MMNHLKKDLLQMGIADAQDQREEMTQFLGIMQRFAELLPEESEVERIGREVVRIIIEETHFENCSLVLWDHKQNCLSLLAAFGLRDQLGEGNHLPYNRKLIFSRDEGVAGRVFSTRSPVFIEDSSKFAIPSKPGAVVRPHSLACLPVVDIGVLNISAHYPLKFSPYLKRNWELLSRFAGFLILKALLNKELDPEASFSRQVLDQQFGASRGGPDAAAESSPPDQTILDHTPQGICLLDFYGKVVRINKTIEKLQGENASEVIGRSPSIFFHEPHIFESLMLEAATSDHAEANDISLVNSSGALYLADLHLTRMADADGRVTGFVLVIHDVTKKKAFAERILRTEKLAALGTMAGGVAHDFNNLLMAILGNIQLVLNQSTDESIRSRLEKVEKAVQDGAHTVRRLQKFTERDKEHLVSVGTVDVSDAIRDVVDLTRPRWKNAMEKNGHTIQVEMELEPNLLALIHASDLREVLTNLVFNAVEAMPEGGTLTLRTYSKEEWACVEIADTGVGMSEDVVRKIFDPFFTTKGVGNSGLGLSVSWSLVSRYGGEIQVRTKPGKGSAFVLKFPKSDSPQLALDFPGMDRREVSHRLLVVDDDTDILDLIRDMLRLKGHQVTATHDPEKALRLIENEDFDLVLTDLGMPVFTGWDVARKAKAKNPHTPVILLTGWGAQYEEEDLTLHGINLVLSKPMSWAKLIESVEGLLTPGETPLTMH